jgi:endonuclease G
MKKNFTLLIVFVIHFFSFAQQEAKTKDGKLVLLYENGTWIYVDSLAIHNKLSNIEKIEIPKVHHNEIPINHFAFSLLYNEQHEQASWIAYNLSATETTKLFERTNKFIEDPKVSTGSATNEDYLGSGFDRGHLAPASDMGWSSTSMLESFYYSNMSPQTPSFNRGIWKKLEEQVRDWAVEYNNIYIVTGPILTNDLPTIGPNKVSIPTYFYKVILDLNNPNKKGIGFILANEASSEQLQHFSVSIDSVETRTGIDFFPLLEDDLEEKIEKKVCIECWTWNSLKPQNQTEHKQNNANNENKNSHSVQCKGITKKGERCKNMTLNKSAYCYHHENQIK